MSTLATLASLPPSNFDEDGPSIVQIVVPKPPQSQSGQSNLSDFESIDGRIFQVSPRDSNPEDGATDCKLTPLLKASPPMPSGSKVGRYRIRIWRATPRQPFGINFCINVYDKKITIGEDVAHLGLRKDDEIVRINHLNASQLDECRTLLEQSTYVDLLLEHREMADIARQKEASCSWNPFDRLSARGREDEEESSERCCTSRSQADASQPLRVLLSVSRPNVLRTTFEDAVEFEITVQRMSLKQRLGMDFAFDPQLPTMSMRSPPKILVAADVHSFGLLRGDQVLQVNGVPYTRSADCQKMLETASTVTLRLKRLSKHGDGSPQVTMAADIEQTDDDVVEVIYSKLPTEPVGCFASPACM